GGRHRPRQSRVPETARAEREGAAARNRRLRSRAPRQYRVAEVCRCVAPDLWPSSAVSGRLRRPRRYEPRRAAAAAGPRECRIAIRVRRRRCAARPAAAEARASMPAKSLTIPRDRDNVLLPVGKHEVRLTNLRKIFWSELGLTKGDLLQYYADVSEVLLPHIEDRAMVMKRYPHGAGGDFFFMKRAPSRRPDWIPLCTIDHGNGNIIDFPVISDLPSLMWVINLGCIDLNQWYATCDDINRPDYLHFDLDPGSATFDQVRETGLVVRDALDTL